MAKPGFLDSSVAGFQRRIKSHHPISPLFAKERTTASMASHLKFLDEVFTLLSGCRSMESSNYKSLPKNNARGWCGSQDKHAKRLPDLSKRGLPTSWIPLLPNVALTVPRIQRGVLDYGVKNVYIYLASKRMRLR